MKYEERKAIGICVHSGCKNKATKGVLCQGHWEQSREYNQRGYIKERKRKYMREYMKIYMPAYLTRRRKVFRQKFISKVGGKCQRCGFSDLRALVFHHKSSSKDLSYYDYDFRHFYDEEYADAELLVLCANCHVILHSERNKHVNSDRD